MGGVETETEPEAYHGRPGLEAAARAATDRPALRQRRLILSPVRRQSTKWAVIRPHRTHACPRHTPAFLARNSSSGVPIREPTDALSTDTVSHEMWQPSKAIIRQRSMWGGGLFLAFGTRSSLPSPSSRWLDRLLDSLTKTGSYQQVLHASSQNLAPSLSAGIHGPRNPEKAEWLE